MWNHYGVKRAIFQEPGHKAQSSLPRRIAPSRGGNLTQARNTGCSGRRLPSERGNLVPLKS
ncbi:MAG: hypothetical protein CFE33_01675 [Pseudorhodobacter sp. PARRP1]|nr:MAG: hypothetical protein CFE33_01675 [Pseudorhodobacter sp. PARRP1]